MFANDNEPGTTPFVDQPSFAEVGAGYFEFKNRGGPSLHASVNASFSEVMEMTRKVYPMANKRSETAGHSAADEQQRRAEAEDCSI